MINMDISISSIIFLTQILVLTSTAILNLIINKKEKRKDLNFYSILLNLVLNTAVWIPSIFNNKIKESTIFNISNGTFIIIDLIYFLGLLLSIFSRNEFESDQISDCLFLLIISCFIGIIITLNLVSLFSCFLTATFLLGTIFYTGEYKKEYKILKFYFIGIIFTTIFLLLSVVVIFLESKFVT